MPAKTKASKLHQKEFHENENKSVKTLVRTININKQEITTKYLQVEVVLGSCPQEQEGAAQGSPHHQSCSLILACGSQSVN